MKNNSNIILQEFKPERFLKEDIVERHPYSYIPFAAGSRYVYFIYSIL